MDSRTPAVSIVMTVFNGERFVREAIQSILDQSLTDFEFVIVDNHSTDSTCDIVEAFDDQRIVFINNDENLGQTRALNLGISRCCAPIIARMDADDIAFPNRLEQQLEYLNRHPEIAVLGSWAKFINEDGRYLRTFKSPCSPAEITLYMCGSPELSYGCSLHPSLMVRRSLFDSTGLFDEKTGASPGYPQDYELWGRAVIKGFQFANLSESLIQYRVLESSESRANEKVLLQYRLQISRDKIRYYCPEFAESENLSLARLLEFLPQKTAGDGHTVFELFDRYFDAYVSDSNVTTGVEKMRSRIKQYYLPVLFLTNRRLSITNYFRLARRNAGVLADILFYRKVAKIVLRNFLSPTNVDSRMRDIERE